MAKDAALVCISYGAIGEKATVAYVVASKRLVKTPSTTPCVCGARTNGLGSNQDPLGIHGAQYALEAVALAANDVGGGHAQVVEKHCGC